MQDLKIYNGFGITPTNTHVSAGTDYYVPNIDENNSDMVERALSAFEKSYGQTREDLLELRQTLIDRHITKNLTNIMHLYLLQR